MKLFYGSNCKSERMEKANHIKLQSTLAVSEIQVKTKQMEGGEREIKCNAQCYLSFLLMTWMK